MTLAGAISGMKGVGAGLQGVEEWTEVCCSTRICYFMSFSYVCLSSNRM